MSVDNHPNANAMLDSGFANASFKSTRSSLAGGHIFVKQLLMLSFTLKLSMKVEHVPSCLHPGLRTLSFDHYCQWGHVQLMLKWMNTKQRD